MIELFDTFMGIVYAWMHSPWSWAATAGLMMFGYTYTTKTANVTAAAAAHINLLQTEKLDRDGQIPLTGVLQWKKGADVASAAALLLGSDGNYFDITGTTAITSITQLAVGGAAVQAGTVVKLHFDAALVLTHHATNLILPAAANISTTAGDEAEFVCYAAGGWRCTNYRRISGFDIKTTAKARAYLSALQTNLVDSTYTKILLDGETYDPGGNFAAYKFVTPVSGYYQINAAIRFSSVVADKEYLALIYVNNVSRAQAQVHSRTTNEISAFVSDVVYLNATDYVELFGLAVAGVSTVDVVGTTISTFLSIHLLSLE